MIDTPNPLSYLARGGEPMRTIERIFGRSPFAPLRKHLQKVGECVEKMDELLALVEKDQWDEVEERAAEVSRLEHEADHIKEDIRNHIPKPLFTAVDKGRLLELLTIQDRIADAAEDVCVLMTFARLPMKPDLAEKFASYRKINVQAFEQAAEIMNNIDGLIRAGFGGAEAEAMREMVRRVAHSEHEADIVQRDLLRTLFNMESELSHGGFYLWMRVIRKLSDVSNQSENLANCVRTTLETK